ncbi:MAG: lysophospholipid acyltransferase family protein, partial [Candidatus Zixiibacteriota bacterium]
SSNPSLCNMRRSKKLKRDTVYLFARAALAFFSAMPRRTALFIGSWLGLLAWRLLGRDRYKFDRHLTLIYGHRLSTRDKSVICRQFFLNSAKNLVDVARFRKHYCTEIKPLVEAEGLVHMENAHARGKGTLGITGHIGNFELLAVYLVNLGYKIAVIGRELYDPRLDRLLVANREAMGLVNIATTDSPRRILEWLKSNGALGVLIDTDSVRVRGTFVPFFGRMANTPIGQSLLGLKADSVFLPMACLRTDNDRYRVIIRPPVQIERSGSLEQDACRVTLACARELERIIDKYKSQWIWNHNRWHTRPEDLCVPPK